MEKCYQEMESLREYVVIEHPYFDFAKAYYDNDLLRHTKYYSKVLVASFLVSHYSDFGEEDLYMWSCCTSSSKEIHHHYPELRAFKEKKGEREKSD